MNRTKKSGRPEKPSAQKRKSKPKIDGVKGKEEEEILVSESSSSESEPEGGKNASEDSDDEEIRVLFQEKMASRNGVQAGEKSLVKKNKRVGNSISKEEVGKVKSKGKKKVLIEEEEEEAQEEEGSACKFPMNRIHRIMKDQNGSTKIAQEAIFLANKASEKFIELYCREAYACAYLDHKNQVGYDHLASVVSKRKRFDFLSDIIPRKVKAEDALAEMPIADE